MKLYVFASIVTLGLTAALTPAWAADDHKGHDHESKGGAHAHEAKPRFGGVVTVVKDVNYELVAKPDVLQLYISDHGKPVELKGASAKLTLLSASDKGEATLSPAGDKLEARGSYKIGAGTKVVAQVSVPGQTPGSVRFTIK